MRRALLCTALTALLAAGCGNERQDSIPLRPEPSREGKTWRFPRAGVTLELPRNFSIFRREYPGVFRASLGDAFLANFAYRRREQLPRNGAELRAARRRLVRAVRRRSRDFELRSSKAGRFAGLRSVELVGDQTISSSRLRTRSIHLFRGSAEYVFELVAPVTGFKDVDRATTPMIERTLRVTGRVKRSSGRKHRRR